MRVLERSRGKALKDKIVVRLGVVPGFFQIQKCSKAKIFLEKCFNSSRNCLAMSAASCIFLILCILFDSNLAEQIKKTGNVTGYVFLKFEHNCLSFLHEIIFRACAAIPWLHACEANGYDKMTPPELPYGKKKNLEH